MPLLVLSLASLVIIVRHGLMESLRTAESNSIREVTTLDRTSFLLENRWRTLLQVSSHLDTAASNTLLQTWIDADSSICLMSVWKSETLTFSHPWRDEAKILLWSDRNWTGVETSARCGEPVVRHMVHQDDHLAAVISVRLSHLSKILLDSIANPQTRFSLVDYQGIHVGSHLPGDSLRRVVDPLLGHPDVKRHNSGWTLEKGRIVAYSSHRLQGPPWILIARQDALGTLRPLAPLLALMLAVLVATTLLSMRMAQKSSRKILTPLRELRKSLVALENGHFESQLPTADLTEIAELSAAYNRMATAIEARETSRRLELERVISELEAFSLSVSHDLRAPLRSIDGYSEAMQADQTSILSPDGHSFLERIRSNVQRMGQLIDDILRLAKTSRAQLNHRTIDMDRMVAEIAAELGSALSGRVIEWRFGPLGTAHGDVGLIHQVWQNLLSNAVKYTSKKPRAVIEIGSESTPTQGVWWVRDNGAGFDPAFQHQLFKDFQRLHNQEFEGTGVGLALVRRIVTKHGGEVSGSGKPGQGATFRFWLPTEASGSNLEPDVSDPRQ